MGMNDQFIFCTTVIGNESLLKEEIRLYFPDLTLSFSGKGLVTFKNKGEKIDERILADKSPVFALRSGIHILKTDEDLLLDDLAKVTDLIAREKFGVHYFNIKGEPFSLVGEEKLASTYSQLNNRARPYEYIVNVIEISPGKFWIGLSFVTNATNPYPNGNTEIVLPPNAPSRAYLKIAEADKIFNLNLNFNDLVIEYGSAPGGATTYLLDKGLKVVGVDPALMDESCANNPNFKHLQIPVQDLSQEKLPDAPVQLVTVDLNLNPKQSLKEVLRLTKKHAHDIRGILFTIKIVNEFHLQKMGEYKKLFIDFGAREVIEMQLSSHKKEYLIYAKF
ncbi:ribosomal RNA large subunit methyltransferase J [Bacteriovorax sp. Seq25_V]|nr:ribosomal RNA large subunit methyltransferase J [Bacteriovorax sp. Seq25_V]